MQGVREQLLADTAGACDKLTLLPNLQVMILVCCFSIYFTTWLSFRPLKLAYRNTKASSSSNS